MKKNKGITLVALVITIIVLLILAGVSIATLVGENGILGQATKSAEESKRAKAEEQIKLISNEWQIEKRTGNIITLEEFLKDKVEKNELESYTKNPDETYTVIVDGYEGILDSEGYLKGDVQLAGPRPTISEIKITTDGTNEPSNGTVYPGTKLKINFTHGIEGGTTTVTPSVPYETDGTETQKEFTIVGTVNGKQYTTKRTIVFKEKYKEIKIVEEPPIEKVTEETWFKDTTSSNKIAVIPKGFKVSNVEGEKQIDKGLVVIAPDGSEFVWIPVNKNTLCVDGTTGKEMAKLQTGLTTNYEGVLYNFTGITSTKMTGTEVTGTGNREPAFLTDTTNADGSAHNNIGLTQVTLQTEYNEIIKSIKKYGGFYVGRYESSLSDSTNTTAATTGNIQSKKGIIPTSSANSKWYGLYDKQQKYSQVIAESNIKSSMIYGSQYDAMLNWALKGEDKAKVTATSNGNHGGSLQPTKSMPNDKINNIYDLEGNLCEWTAEAFATAHRAFRAGAYDRSSSPPSIRRFTFPNNSNVGSDVGSRTTLYL